MIPLKYHFPFDPGPASPSECVCDVQRHKCILAQIPGLSTGSVSGVFSGWCSAGWYMRVIVILPGMYKDTQSGNDVYLTWTSCLWISTGEETGARRGKVT